MERLSGVFSNRISFLLYPAYDLFENEGDSADEGREELGCENEETGEEVEEDTDDEAREETGCENEVIGEEVKTKSEEVKEDTDAFNGNVQEEQDRRDLPGEISARDSGDVELIGLYNTPDEDVSRLNNSDDKIPLENLLRNDRPHSESFAHLSEAKTVDETKTGNSQTTKRASDPFLHHHQTLAEPQTDVISIHQGRGDENNGSQNADMADCVVYDVPRNPISKQSRWVLSEDEFCAEFADAEDDAVDSCVDAEDYAAADNVILQEVLSDYDVPDGNTNLQRNEVGYTDVKQSGLSKSEVILQEALSDYDVPDGNIHLHRGEVQYTDVKQSGSSEYDVPDVKVQFADISSGLDVVNDEDLDEGAFSHTEVKYVKSNGDMDVPEGKVVYTNVKKRGFGIVPWRRKKDVEEEESVYDTINSYIDLIGGESDYAEVYVDTDEEKKDTGECRKVEMTEKKRERYGVNDDSFVVVDGTGDEMYNEMLVGDPMPEEWAKYYKQLSVGKQVQETGARQVQETGTRQAADTGARQVQKTGERQVHGIRNLAKLEEKGQKISTKERMMKFFGLKKGNEEQRLFEKSLEMNSVAKASEYEHEVKHEEKRHGIHVDAESKDVHENVQHNMNTPSIRSIITHEAIEHIESKVIVRHDNRKRQDIDLKGKKNHVSFYEPIFHNTNLVANGNFDADEVMNEPVRVITFTDYGIMCTVVDRNEFRTEVVSSSITLPKNEGRLNVSCEDNLRIVDSNVKDDLSDPTGWTSLSNETKRRRCDALDNKKSGPVGCLCGKQHRKQCVSPNKSKAHFDPDKPLCGPSCGTHVGRYTSSAGGGPTTFDCRAQARMEGKVTTAATVVMEDEALGDVQKDDEKMDIDDKLTDERGMMDYDKDMMDEKTNSEKEIMDNENMKDEKQTMDDEKELQYVTDEKIIYEKTKDNEICDEQLKEHAEDQTSYKGENSTVRFDLDATMDEEMDNNQESSEKFKNEETCQKMQLGASTSCQSESGDEVKLQIEEEEQDDFMLDKINQKDQIPPHLIKERSRSLFIVDDVVDDAPPIVRKRRSTAAYMYYSNDRIYLMDGNKFENANHGGLGFDNPAFIGEDTDSPRQSRSVLGHDNEGYVGDDDCSTGETGNSDLGSEPPSPLVGVKIPKNRDHKALHIISKRKGVASALANETLKLGICLIMSDETVDDLKKVSQQNLKMGNGETFLMVASRVGQTDIVKELLRQSHIDVNAVDNDNWTALLNTAREGHHDIAELLINSGALVEHKDMGGWTALMWACYKGKLDTCRVLLDSGANPNVKGEHHMSCVTWAAGRGYTDIVSQLLARGAQVNTADKYGTTPLIWAARRGHKNIVDLLLMAGANVDNAGMYSWTALIVAAKAGYTDVVEVLLGHHPNVNTGDKDGYTALTWAAKDGHTEIVQQLLQAGAYVNPPDRFGDTILIHATKGGHLDVVKALLKKCADVDVEGVDNKTALYWASEKGHASICKAILDYNPNLEITNKDGDTALLKSVRNRNIEIVKAMLDKGAKISTQDKKGDTALHIAVRARSKRVTELLLRNPKEGRLLYKPNKGGETPYHLDSKHERRLLTQVYGAQNLNADDNIQGYDLYSNTIADVLSEPSLHTPINVGLYAKWGSGKSFLISRLIRDMKAFTEHSTDPFFEFSWIQFTLSFLLSVIIGIALGFGVRWEVGLGVGLGIMFLQYLFLVIVWVGTSRKDWLWAEKVGDYIARKIQYLRLLLKIMFCNEPVRPDRESAAVKFLFTDNARLASVVGDKFITAMIATLCEALEKEYGTIVTRLYKVMQPKKASVHGRFKSICCIPYFLVVLILLCMLIAIGVLLAIFGIHNITDARYTVLDSVLLGLGITIVIALIINAYTWARMCVSIAVPARRRVQKIAHSMDASKIESFMQKLKKEVELLGKMTRCMDACLNTHTRLVVIVDGLDSCEQEKLLQVLDTVHMLFSDSDSPFITILAVDPHVIIKGIENNLHGLFRESSINGHDYLRNIVQLPFFLQNQAIPRARAYIRDESHTNLTGASERRYTARSMSRESSQMWTVGSRAESLMSSSMVSLDDIKRKQSRKRKNTEGPSNLLRQPSNVDLSKSLGKNTYFSDVNPRNMKRLMNIIAVTGRLLRANHVELNWYKLAAWANITEQWPYRLSWIILEVEDNEEIEDSSTLKNIYERIQPRLPNHKDIDPLLEIDRNARKLDIFLTNHMPILTVGDMRRFLPCTINVDPYLRKLIRELQQTVAEQADFMGVANQMDPASWHKRPSSTRADFQGRESPRPPGRPGSSLHATMSPYAMAGQPPNPGFYPQFGAYMPPGFFATPPPQPKPSVSRVTLKGSLPSSKLSAMSVEEVAQLLENIDGISHPHIPMYVARLQQHNICGTVLITCNLSELKPVMQMTFGDWELFRSLVAHLREQEGVASEEDLTFGATGPAPHSSFGKPVPPFNVDHKLHMPQPHYADDSSRRRRHSSGEKKRPQRLLTREQTDPNTLNFNAQIPQNGSLHFKPRQMVRKDSTLGEVMMETAFLRGVVEASGVCTDDSEDDILEDEEGEKMVSHDLTSDSGMSVVIPAITVKQTDYQRLATEESVKPTQFALGAYKSSDDSDDLEEVTVRPGKKNLQKTKASDKPPVSRTPSSTLNGSVVTMESQSETTDDKAPMISKSSKSREKLHRLFSGKKSKESSIRGDESQRTSVGSSIFSGTEMDQIQAELGSSLAELSDFDPVLTPASSSEYVALRKLSQKEDPSAPSAFKSVTPCSSRASSRASSYTSSAPIHHMAAVAALRQQTPPAVVTAGDYTEALVDHNQDTVLKRPARKSPPTPPLSLPLDDEISFVEDEDAKESGHNSPHSNASLEEIRITMPQKKPTEDDVFA